MRKLWRRKQVAAPPPAYAVRYPQLLPEPPSRRQPVLVGVGVSALLAAMVAVAPAWWWREIKTAGVVTARFWLPAVLLILAMATLGVAATQWWNADWRTRRTGAMSVVSRLPLFVHVALLLVLAVAVAVGLGWLLWQAFGRPTIHAPAVPPPSRASSPPSSTPAWSVSNTFDAMKIVLSVVAGIGGVVALTVAYRKQDLGEAAERREDTKLFTDRFGKAADQLGSEQAAVRLAGVYAMARLADDWAEERQTCIDVLCAYLRMPYTPLVDTSQAEREPSMPAPGDPPTGKRDPKEERQVRHTILRLISDHLRTPQRDSASWRGFAFDFTGVVFDGGDFTGALFTRSRVSFERAQFIGEVSFGGAQFTGGEVSFSYARFAGALVSFTAARFTGGRVSFFAAQFTGGEVYFQRAQFAGGEVSFYGAEFTGSEVSFSGAEFSGGEVSFQRARFTGGAVPFFAAQFTGGEVSFKHAEFTGGELSFYLARFTGGEVSFGGAQFSGGAVDVSEPDSYVRPPTFDDWPDGPPTGLRLPVGSGDVQP